MNVNNLIVLIVEDDEISELYLRKALKSFSNKLLSAKNGALAVEICRNNPDLDLILMDIQMPEMDGYEAIRRIREFNKKVFIVAQTAFALTGDREKTIKSGADEYISKPIRIDELHSIIKNHFKIE